MSSLRSKPGDQLGFSIPSGAGIGLVTGKSLVGSLNNERSIADDFWADSAPDGDDETSGTMLCSRGRSVLFNGKLGGVLAGSKFDPVAGGGITDPGAVVDGLMFDGDEG